MIRVIRLSLAVISLLIIAAPVFAQRDRDTFASGPSVEISGQVNTDEGPVRNAPVRLERFGGGIADQMNTDNRGRFRFMGMGRGHYNVVVQAPGFRFSSQTVDLQVVFKTFLMFDLVPDMASLPSDAVPGVIDSRVPQAARIEYGKGRSALAGKKIGDAIRYLKKSIIIYPDFFEAQLILGTSYLDARDWSKAEDALTRAIEITPDSAPPRFSLGEVYWRQKRYAPAERELLAGLKLDPNSWHGHFTLARLYWDMNDIAKAGPAIGRTLQSKPDFAEAHLLAGNILLKLNQQERALLAYDDYLRLDPKGEFAVQTRELTRKLRKTLSDKQK